MMANPEHVERLKRSVAKWNLWRRQHPQIRPDLSKANLSRADLTRTRLTEADLNNAILTRSLLNGADLTGASLRGTSLDGAILTIARLYKTSLTGAFLSGAILTKANLNEADLTGAILSEVYDTEAYTDDGYSTEGYLSGANLSGAKLTNTVLSEALFSHTTFAEVDLSNAKDLETAIHRGRSYLDINTVILPQDEPTRLHFLRGVGFTETQIEYLPSLLTPRPIQYHSLFISYTRQDQAIAERLYTNFRKNDIPCWFAPHELIPGDYYRYKIDEAINRHDKLVLILSEHSIKSQWVEKEVETALKREESMNMDQQVLFPIRLDDAAMTTNRRWISSLRYHRHIGDFTGWQDEAFYQQAFTTLLRHLKVTKL